MTFLEWLTLILHFIVSLNLFWIGLALHGRNQILRDDNCLDRENKSLRQGIKAGEVQIKYLLAQNEVLKDIINGRKAKAKRK